MSGPAPVQRHVAIGLGTLVFSFAISVEWGRGNFHGISCTSARGLSVTCPTPCNCPLGWGLGLTAFIFLPPPCMILSAGYSLEANVSTDCTGIFSPDRPLTGVYSHGTSYTVYFPIHRTKIPGGREGEMFSQLHILSLGTLTAIRIVVSFRRDDRG